MDQLSSDLNGLINEGRAADIADLVEQAFYEAVIDGDAETTVIRAYLFAQVRHALDDSEGAAEILQSVSAGRHPRCWEITGRYASWLELDVAHALRVWKPDLAFVMYRIARESFGGLGWEDGLAECSAELEYLTLTHDLDWPSLAVARGTLTESNLTLARNALGKGHPFSAVRPLLRALLTAEPDQMLGIHHLLLLAWSRLGQTISVDLAYFAAGDPLMGSARVPELIELSTDYGADLLERGAYERARELFDLCRESAAGVDDTILAALAIQMADLAVRCGDDSAGEELLEAALSLAGPDDTAQIAQSRMLLGAIWGRRGEWKDGSILVRGAAASFAELGMEAEVGLAYVALAELCMGAPEINEDEAWTHLARARGQLGAEQRVVRMYRAAARLLSLTRTRDGFDDGIQFLEDARADLVGRGRPLPLAQIDADLGSFYLTHLDVANSAYEVVRRRRRGMDSLLPAVLAIGALRFQFGGRRERALWTASQVDEATAQAFASAAASGHVHTLAGLITDSRSVGIYTLWVGDDEPRVAAEPRPDDTPSSPYLASSRRMRLIGFEPLYLEPPPFVLDPLGHVTLSSYLAKAGRLYGFRLKSEVAVALA